MDMHNLVFCHCQILLTTGVGTIPFHPSHSFFTSLHCLLQSVAYFTNPSYPLADSKPNACMIKIKPQAGTCWVNNMKNLALRKFNFYF